MLLCNSSTLIELYANICILLCLLRENNVNWKCILSRCKNDPFIIKQINLKHISIDVISHYPSEYIIY